MIKGSIVLASTFVINVLFIFASYMNFDLGLGVTGRYLDEQNIPILKTAVILTVSCPVCMLIAFYGAKNDYDNYQMALIGLCVMVSVVVVIALLPVDQHELYIIRPRPDVLLIGLLVIQYCSIKMLARDFWNAGKPGNEE